jgi:hypothetical protein
MEPFEDVRTTRSGKPAVRVRNLRHTAGAAARQTVAALGVVLVMWLTASARAAEPDLNLAWRDGYKGLTFDFQGQRRTYPDDLNPAQFPAPGKALDVAVTAEWPVVTLHARWSAAVDGWPAAYRAQALDLILMWACDAELYAYVYADTIKESKFTYPPEYLREAAAPLKTGLAAALRGQRVAYEITGKGGFGAADYTIRTEIHVGLSADERTVFYHDNPKSISEHLSRRDYVFMAHDAGDRLLFEIHAVCICAPRRLFRGEALRRVQSDGESLIRTMHERLRAAPTEKEIQAYLESVRERTRTFDTVGDKP